MVLMIVVNTEGLLANPIQEFFLNLSLFHFLKEERRSRVRREQLTRICLFGPRDFCTGASSKLMEGLGGLEDSLIFYDVQGVSRDDFFFNK